MKTEDLRFKGCANDMGEAKTISALRKLFVMRSDCFCIQLKHGYVKINEPLTDNHLLKHLRGEVTVGSYQLSVEGFVKWLCFDLDPEKLSDARETAQKLFNVMFEEKVEPDGVKRPKIWPKAVLLEASRYPDSSYHIWIFFLLPVPAKVAHWLGYRILELSSLNPKEVEVFPKQRELTEQRPYGNFVKLPLGKHQAKNKRSCFLDFETFQPLPSEVLFEVRGISFSEADVAKILSFKQKRDVQTTFELPQNFKPLKSREEEKIASFLTKYWVKGRRNRLELAFLGWAIKRGLAYESAKRIVNHVTQLTNDEEAIARLQLVDYHYKNRVSMSPQLLGISGLKQIVKEALD